MIFLSPSRKGRKGCAQQITDNVYSFPTKTIKILAVIFLVPSCFEASFGPPAPGRNSLRSSGLHHGKENHKNR